MKHEDKPPLSAIQVFDISDNDSLVEWKKRYSGPRFTHRTGVRRVKFDSAYVDVVVAVARRKGETK